MTCWGGSGVGGRGSGFCAKNVRTDHPKPRGKESEFRQMLLTWYTSLSPAQRLKTLLLVSSDAAEANSAGKLIYDGLRGVVAKMREVDRSWANQHLNCYVGFTVGG